MKLKKLSVLIIMQSCLTCKNVFNLVFFGFWVTNAFDTWLAICM